MGLFAQRPEFNDEWAGIPSEPLEPESAAESLPPADAEISAMVEGGIGSIVIPLPPPPLEDAEDS